MSWLRVGDTFATDPRVLELGSVKDDRLLNEVVGFVVRCAAQSAGHKQDAFVSDATTTLVGGVRAKLLSRTAHRAGIFVERTKKDGVPGWQLLVAPELLHIRLQAEVDWEAKHRQLLRDPDVFLPVRLRDGDGCRYCARIVIWKDARSGRGGTLDHVIPDGADLVVACKSCNSKKQDRTLDEAGMTLLPIPVEPHYSAHTLAVFHRYGITDPRPGAQSDTAPPVRDPAASRTPPPSTTSDPAPNGTTPHSDPATTPDTAPHDRSRRGATKHRPSTDQPDRAQPDQDLPGRVRVGHGSGSGVPAPNPRPPARAPRTRGRRGRSTPSGSSPESRPDERTQQA